ncbi:MAG: hypothetical protein RLZZ127_888 [Planctomycetota bacterium]|jgi:hypothetical protein
MRCAPLAALILLAGCADGPRDPHDEVKGGYVITPRGGMLQTANNAKKDAEERLREAIQGDLPPGWVVQLAVAEHPQWIEPRQEADIGEWRWRSASATVDLVGSGAATAPATARYQQAVVDFFAPRMLRRGVGITATVAVVVDRSRYLAVTGPASALVVTPPPSPAAAPATAWPKTYLIQPGDTLAVVSELFYGDARHWRRIVAANPGLDPATMTVGTALVIPAPE